MGRLRYCVRLVRLVRGCVSSVIAALILFNTRLFLIEKIFLVNCDKELLIRFKVVGKRTF